MDFANFIKGGVALLWLAVVVLIVLAVVRASRGARVRALTTAIVATAIAALVLTSVSAGLVFIWFTPLMTTNLLAFNLGATVYLIVGAMFEERKLLREYGQEYARYRSQTPMLVPGLKFFSAKQN